MHFKDKIYDLNYFILVLIVQNHVLIKPNVDIMTEVKNCNCKAKLLKYYRLHMKLKINVRF